MHSLPAVIILPHIFQIYVVGVNLTLETRREDPIQWWTAPLDAELDDGRISRVFTLIVCGWIPELDDIVTARCNDICNGLLIPNLSDEVCGDERPTCD